jgi:hypothetical protein
VLDYINVGIRNYHDAGQHHRDRRSPLANLASLLDRLGRYEPAGGRFQLV